MNKKEELHYAAYLFIATMLFLYSLLNNRTFVILAAFFFSAMAFRLYRKKHPRVSRNYQDIVKERRMNKKAN